MKKTQRLETICISLQPKNAPTKDWKSASQERAQMVPSVGLYELRDASGVFAWASTLRWCSRIGLHHPQRLESDSDEFLRAEHRAFEQHRLLGRCGTRQFFE
jgi:hypothetical protein